jgi:hypothetical protein
LQIIIIIAEKKWIKGELNCVFHVLLGIFLQQKYLNFNSAPGNNNFSAITTILDDIKIFMTFSFN